MDIFEVVEQLKKNGYTGEHLKGRQIIVTSTERLKASGFERDAIFFSDIVIIDGLIFKDRTGYLEGERAPIWAFQ